MFVYLLSKLQKKKEGEEKQIPSHAIFTRISDCVENRVTPLSKNKGFWF